jgi:hypothetical protein
MRPAKGRQLDAALQYNRQLSENGNAASAARAHSAKKSPLTRPPAGQSITQEGETTMGMFSDLMQKIFHHAAPAERPADAAGSARPTTIGGAATAVVTPVDVAAILNKLASENKEKLDWKNSIVDLMKLVGMDSSLSARKILAAELHFSGDTNDSASMNIWLHKEVMRKLAENGGKLPADLLDN